MLTLLLFIAETKAANYPVNPNLADRRHYVADEAGILTRTELDEINERLWNLREQTSVEMAVAILKDLDGKEIQPYSVGLFEEWGLGKSDKDNGVLLVVDMGGHKAFITTGYGVEGVLPDITCTRIIREKMVPLMHEGKSGEAIVAAVNITASILEDPSVAGELLSGETEAYDRGPDTLDREALLNALMWIVAIVTLFGIILFIRDCVRVKKLDNYHRAKMWRSEMPLFWVMALFSAGILLPVALLGLYNYYRSRNSRIKCPTCGAKMNKLSEDKDNELLNRSQDFEERLGTVDYDVWLCPECGTVERFPFRENQSTYMECPACHTVALRLVSDRIIKYPTTRQSGMGVKTYECLFCHHKEERPYKIPPKDDNSKLLAGMALGAALGSSGRSSGGSGFSGGFGGGHTGGGGGGAGW